MDIKIPDIEVETRKAVSLFWKSRKLAMKSQKALGRFDQGNRGAVTGGKNMDGFVELIKSIVVKNGLNSVDVITSSDLVTLPGFFRPTKKWDILIIHKGALIAALELKSHVGSLGNNFNNRCEEALGTATDIWTAFREGALGKSSKPFIGYLILVEDSEKTRRPVKEKTPNFPVFQEFKNSSYAKRYELLCERLVKENLYTTTALLLSPPKGGLKGDYSEPNQALGLSRLMVTLAAHVAATAVIEKTEVVSF